MKQILASSACYMCCIDESIDLVWYTDIFICISSDVTIPYSILAQCRFCCCIKCVAQMCIAFLAVVVVVIW